MRGLDPRTHHEKILLEEMMDCRVQPGNDSCAHTGLIFTFSPSRGFGIGHICQSGL
jgi:hypothetical protein